MNEQYNEEQEQQEESAFVPVDERDWDGFKSGYVAVIGRPNVGKSTLMNRFLGEKLAIVSPKPQTTRQNQLGILTTADAQVIFVDTPGIHRARTALGDFMVEAAKEALADADVILFLVDMSAPLTQADHMIAETIRTNAPETPLILAMNKLDLLKPDEVLPRSEQYLEALAPNADWLAFSAKYGDGAGELFDKIMARLPEGPKYYPEEQLSDFYVRDIAAEIIREKVLKFTEQEVPHATAVAIEEFKERSESLTYINANIYVERDSQKGIVIGKGGRMLKKIGAAAREDIEALLETQVYLDLHVRLLKNWRTDESALRRLGFTK